MADRMYRWLLIKIKISSGMQIQLRDDDDFDIGLIYKTNADEFENVLHELINWMHDHEQGISIYENIWNVYDFFPDCGCERTKW